MSATAFALVEPSAKESIIITIPELKEQIRNAGYEKFEEYGSGWHVPKTKLIGTMYMVERMDYGFHIYYIHEPSTTNSIAGKDGIVTEMYYDLRNKIYWIKRNMKEVQFSPRNVDSIFPRNSSMRQEVFDFLSTPRNTGLYEAAFKYLGSMGKERTEMFGRFFHRLITEHSYFELLHKAGIEMNGNLIIRNYSGKSPLEILGLSKTQWKMHQKFGVSIKKLQNYYKNDEADNRLINLLTYVKTLEVEYGIDKMQSFVNMESDFIYDQYCYRSALQLVKRYNLPEKHFIRYIYFECDISQGLSVNDALSNYADYIRMSTEMGFERFDRYPKFLKTYHDIVARNYQVKLDEIQMKQWNEACERNSKFKYAYDGYKIFTPMTPQDLVREGNVLGHCVASYVGKVRQGTSIIAFLRKADDEDKPLVTIEIVKDSIVQVRGKMNNPPTEEQDAIVKLFAKKFELQTKY